MFVYVALNYYKFIYTHIVQIKFKQFGICLLYRYTLFNIYSYNQSNLYNVYILYTIILYDIRKLCLSNLFDIYVLFDKIKNLKLKVYFLYAYYKL